MFPSAWPFQVEELGREEGSREHAGDRLCTEFVSPEICVSSPAMFLDSFPQLAADIYLTPRLLRAGNAESGGCECSPCCRGDAWGLTAPRGHAGGRTRVAACPQTWHLAARSGRAPVGSGAQHFGVQGQSRHTQHGQKSPCQAQLLQVTNPPVFGGQDTKPCVPKVLRASIITDLSARVSIRQHTGLSPPLCWGHCSEAGTLQRKDPPSLLPRLLGWPRPVRDLSQPSPFPAAFPSPA